VSMHTLLSIKLSRKLGLLTLLLGIFITFPYEKACANYRYEGPAFYAETTPATGNSPVYRFYNRNSDKHFFTISEEERTLLQYTHPEWGHVFEGIGFYASTSPGPNLVPIYRLYNRATDNHLYTLSDAEKKLVINDHPEWGYIYEGIAMYVHPSQFDSTLPVYRFYNPLTDRHFLTLSEIEKAMVINGNLGPDISVGLFSDTRNGIQNNPFKIKANKPYSILDKNNNIIAHVPAATITRVTYDANGNLKLLDSIPERIVSQKVQFQATDGNNGDMIFDVFKPDSSFDQYRGRTSVRYSDVSKNIWMINTLPLEQYTWGMGEITGTGHANYNRTMVTAYRTYGLWKIYYSTKYATEGFTVDATPGNQIYSGYDWEISHPNIKTATQETLGSIAMHGNDIALSPYSSWTDGRTRSFLERFGSTQYPWCQSVADPYGKHPSQSTAQLEASGNHMVGISANGALKLASSEKWDWRRIISYYLNNVSVQTRY
jgi:Repeat of unknown function (DUF5648)